MSESPLIFVSHSSKDDELTRQFCQALTGPPGSRVQQVEEINLESSGQYTSFGIER